MAFNDPGSPGVNKALRETVARTKTPFRRPSFLDNTLFFEFRPSVPWRLEDTARLLKLRAFLGIRRWQSKTRLPLPQGVRRFARGALRSILG